MHKRLLLKLEYYGIRGHYLNWMQSWLLNRTQEVVLEGEYSEESNVKSGVPLGTVLRLCFLLYINDMGNISSNLKVFANDNLLYGLVHNVTDALYLQQDLGTGKAIELAPLQVLCSSDIKNPTIHHARSNTKGCRPPTLFGHYLLRHI